MVRARTGLAAAVLVPLALVGMLACAAGMLARIYDGELAAYLLIGAGAGAVAASVATRPLPAWAAAPVSTLALAGYTALVIKLSADAGDVPGGIADLARDALRNGIPRLLTAMIPIRPQPDTLTVPVLAIWLSGLAAAELALRNRRVLLSYAPVAVLVGAVLYTVGPNARPAPWLPLGFAAAAALGLAASAGTGGGTAPELTGREHTALRARTAAGALGGLLAVLGIAGVLGPLVAARIDGNPSDPRRYVTPPHLDSLDESPLARLSGWALDPGQHLFDARLRGGTTRIRLAVLGNYDGVTWRVGGSYRAAGRVLSGPQAGVAGGGGGPHPRAAAGGTAGTDADAGAARAIEQRITIDQLDGRLLPAAAVPERIEGVHAAYDPATTTLALPDGLRPGLTYTVVSRQPEINVNLLPAAQVPRDAATTRRFVTLAGELPPDMERLAEQLAEAASTPYQRAQAVERFLAEHYTVVADAPSGHAYPNLSFFLFGPRNGGGQRGTSEQFAAAFAVLGRILGLPTRVVVGFVTDPDRVAVRAADALAWPEVLFDGVGWVPFNPMPEPDTKPRPVEADFRPTPEPTTPPPSAVTTPPVSSAPPSTASQPAAAAGDDPSGDGPLTAVVGCGAALLLLGAGAAVPLLRRSRRRRRLWGGEPRSRVLGAWREVLDALRQADRQAPASLAATEVSGYAVLAAAGQLHGPRRPRSAAPPGTLDDLDDLAGLVNVVTFAPATVHSAQADRAVEIALRYLRELRSRQPRWRRLSWAFDPRPLWWD